MRQNLYTVEEVKSVLSKFADDDNLVLYDANDIQKIFSLGSISTARKLMNTPAFPSMRVGRKLLITKGNLKKYIATYSQDKIDI